MNSFVDEFNSRLELLEKEKGLILRVSYGGKKVFYFYKKVMKKPRMVRIGDFPDISIAEAREITLDLKNQVACRCISCRCFQFALPNVRRS